MSAWPGSLDMSKQRGLEANILYHLISIAALLGKKGYRQST